MGAQALYTGSLVERDISPVATKPGYKDLVSPAQAYAYTVVPLKACKLVYACNVVMTV